VREEGKRRIDALGDDPMDEVGMEKIARLARMDGWAHQDVLALRGFLGVEVIWVFL
jgi:hypothetical protein